MDYRIYKLNRGEFIRYSLTGLALDVVFSYVFYKSIIVFLIFAPAAFLYPRYKRRELKAKRAGRLASEFRECIQIIASSLSAGYSFENAMKECEQELSMMLGNDSMMVRECAYINHRVSMNIPVEKAWEEFAVRSDSEDIKNFTRIIRLAKRSGGELRSIIARSADTIGDKIKIDEDIKTMTAAKRLEQKVMNVIPVLIVIYISLTSPGFFDTMYTTLMGRIVMSVCLVVYIAAMFISKKVLDIEV